MNIGNLSRGIFTDAHGKEEAIFLRVRPYHQEKERLALQRIQSVQSGRSDQTIPAPRFIGMLQQEKEPGTVLFQSYIPGIDFAMLLPPDERPPSPVDYHYAAVEIKSLIQPLEELGRAIANLHKIRTAHFGSLRSEHKPKKNGRHFTIQKVDILLKQGIDHGWLHLDDAQRLRSWIERRIEIFPADEQACLVHADLHPGNIRVRQGSDKSWHLQGIIDFEHAKYWYPEYDLVVLQWHLQPQALLWEAFMQAYGPLDPARMQLFEIVKLLMIISGHAPMNRYSQWAYTQLRMRLHLLGIG